MPRPADRLPVVQPGPFTPTVPASVPTAVPAIAPPPAEVKQLFLRNGLLVLPRHNEVTLAATEQAELISLNTEQRDAAGNPVLDGDGNLIMIPVVEGMNVFKGQVLVRFDDRELRSVLKINQAELEVAKAEKDKVIEQRLAAHSVLVALADLEVMLEANRRVARTYSAMEVRRAELAKEQAEASLELQKYNIEEIKTREVVVQESKLEQTKVKIDLRQLITPIDGMIVEIKAAEGEWLREGDEVLKIVQLDTLWVRAKVNAKEYEMSDLDGKQAVIHVPLANGRVEMFQGIVVCSPLVDHVSHTFEVNIKVQNRRVGNFWLLQPGRDGVDIVIPL